MIRRDSRESRGRPRPANFRVRHEVTNTSSFMCAQETDPAVIVLGKMKNCTGQRYTRYRLSDDPTGQMFLFVPHCIHVPALSCFFRKLFFRREFSAMQVFLYHGTDSTRVLESSVFVPMVFACTAGRALQLAVFSILIQRQKCFDAQHF